MAKFFITVRSVSKNNFSNSLGKIRYLSVPDDEPPAPTHEITLKPWLTQIMATLTRNAAGLVTGNILFFVHGFNTGIADVDATHAKITAGLDGRFPCTVISFDWPSADETFAYLADLDTARQTAIQLVNAGVKPLLNVQTIRWEPMWCAKRWTTPMTA